VAEGTFTIIGFHPVEAVQKLSGANGISLRANLRDLRSEARSHAVAVMPIVSGAGIKNKLLEAAALGLPVVCTPAAAQGLRGNPPLILGNNPQQLADGIVSLWQDRAKRLQQGAAARAWVLEHHTWTATAREAIAALES